MDKFNPVTVTMVIVVICATISAVHASPVRSRMARGVNFVNSRVHEAEDLQNDQQIYLVSFYDNAAADASPSVLLYPVQSAGVADDSDDHDDDLSTAQTQIFRPLFTYRREQAKRLRLRRTFLKNRAQYQ